MIDNWISVTEYSPKNGQRVLVIQNPKTTATKEPLFAVYINGEFRPPEDTYFADFTQGVTNWSDVIYWTPLPDIKDFIIEYLKQ